MVWMLTSFQTFVFGSTLAKHLFTSTNNTVLQGNIKHHSVQFTDSNIMLHTCILVTKNNDIHCYSCNLLSTRMLQCGVYRYSYQNILVYQLTASSIAWWYSAGFECGRSQRRYKNGTSSTLVQHSTLKKENTGSFSRIKIRK